MHRQAVVFNSDFKGVYIKSYKGQLSSRSLLEDVLTSVDLLPFRRLLVVSATVSPLLSSNNYVMNSSLLFYVKEFSRKAAERVSTESSGKSQSGTSRYSKNIFIRFPAENYIFFFFNEK